MKVPVGSLLACVLFMVGCSKEKTAEGPPAEAPERVVSLEQIEATPEGFIRVKGELEVFNGRVVDKYPNGRIKEELTIVNGMRHGTYVKWHLNGKKSDEQVWKANMPEGLARGWFPTGVQFYETTYKAGRREGVYMSWFMNGTKRLEVMYRNNLQEGPSTEWLEDGSVARRRLWIAGKVVKELDTEKLEEEAKKVVAERERLDRTLWKDETQAQVYEETFVKLWDELRAAKDKWQPLEKFKLDLIRLPKEKRVEKHDWGITADHYTGNMMELDRMGWRKWVENLRSKDVEIIETEWHQEAFHAKGPSSTFNFVVHAIGLDQMRYIMRGKFYVEWSNRKDDEGHFEAGKVDVYNVVVYGRKGVAPFRELARFSPLKDEPREGMPLLVYDLDRDGDSEVMMAGANVVYWNEGKGRFRKATLCKTYPSPLMTGVIADFDGDGLADLLGQSEVSAPVLYRGAKGGQFSRPPEVITDLKAIFRGGSCLTAGDIDGDGDLDVWLTQYKSAYKFGQMPTPYYDANDGYPSFLFINDGKGNFKEGTVAAGLARKRFRRTYSSSFVDLDEDHDLDLVVVSDFAGLDVYLNDGKGHFTDVSNRLGSERYSFGMGHALADFNGDARLDLYMVGMGSTTARRLEGMKLGRKEFPEHQEARMKMGYGNRMMLGSPGGALKQAAYNDQVARTGWAWGCTPLDFDNDGDRDLYVANGHISGKTAKDHCTTFWRHDIYTGSSKYNRGLTKFFSDTQTCLDTISWNGFEHNVLLMNEAPDSFLNVAFLMNASHEYDSRAIVGDDLDGDGRTDLLVVEQENLKSSTGMALNHLHLLRNAWEGSGHWIGVTLHEHGPGLSPIGAKITVFAEGKRQVMQVVTGDSFRAQHANQKHFGLGAVEKVEKIEIRWPNGKISRLESPAVDRYHEVKP